MDTIRRDLRHAARRLRRYPGFTIIALLSLALGIGANTAIFSLVNAVLLRKLPLQQPDRLVDVYMQMSDFPYAPFSYPDYRDLRDASTDVFQGIAASKLSLVPRNLPDHVESLFVELVNGSYFPVLGIQPRLGRLFSDADDVAPGAHPVVVLSYRYWQSAFGEDPGVVGHTIRLGGRPFTVVGVAPRDYTGSLRGLEPALYLPIMMMNVLEPSTVDQLQARDSRSIFLKARLGPGVAMAQAQATVAGVAAQLREQHTRSWGPKDAITLVPTNRVIINPSFDRVIFPAAGALMVVVGLVLLIACANLASFLVAQARDRRREIAIRLALGARRSVLIRQFLSETVMLSLMGGAAGVILAQWFLHMLESADLPIPLPVTLDLGLDGRVLGFALLVSVAAGLLFGLAPALQTTNPDVAPTLKDETTGGGPPRRFTLRNILVVSQVAVSLVLLVSAGLFLRSFQARQNVDPGFGQQPAAIVWIGLSPDRYTPEIARNFLRQVTRRVNQLPGVNAVGWSGNLPLNPVNTQTIDINVDGYSPPPGTEAFSIDWSPADSGFFRAMGIPIVQGRNFSVTDAPDAPGVAIVNQTMARRFWPGQDPLNHVLHTSNGDVRIVGVARDTRVRTLGEAPRPFVYLPLAQRYSTLVYLIAQTRADAAASLGPILGVLHDLDPDLTIFQSKTMARHLAGMILPARLGALAFSTFATLALLLAVIGLYGIVSYTVARRTREMGIRISLGASSTTIVRTLMGHGIRLVLLGGAIGLALAVLVTRVLQSLLFGVGALDPLTFIAVPGILLAVALLAAFLPARRAGRIDPVRALKAE